MKNDALFISFLDFLESLLDYHLLRGAITHLDDV